MMVNVNHRQFNFKVMGKSVDGGFLTYQNTDGLAY